MDKKLTVVDAVCKRVLERSDTLCADVEVKIAGEENPYIAILTEANEKDYELSMLLKNDANRELDWYDNDLHAAYEDVTEKLLRDPATKADFTEQVLTHGTVRADVRRMLSEAKVQKEAQMIRA
jgi:hypothetical protein